MSLRTEFGRYIAAAVILCAPAILAQNSDQSAPYNPPASNSSSAGQGGDKGSSPGRFPFPGEDVPSTGAPKTVTGAPAANAPPAAPDASAQKNSGKDFPFPDETPPAPPPSGSSSNSSSSSSSSSDTPDAADAAGTTSDKIPDSDKAPDKDKAPEGRRLLKRVNPPGTKLQSPDEREAEDLDIAKYYSQTGDFNAAYMRGKDAVKIAPDDPDAHCALARAAVKLNKRDEAIAEYNACLKLDPVEKEAKEAHKELSKLK